MTNHRQHGGQPGGEPPKSKRGLLIAVVVAVLVLAGGGTAVWLLTGNDDSPDGASQDPATQQSDPTSADDPTPAATPTGESTSAGDAVGDPNAVGTVAQDYVAAVNGADEAAATQLTCDKSTPGTLYEVVAGQGQVRTGAVTMVSDDTATVGITLQDGSSEPTLLRLLLEDGAWCVAI